MPSARQIRLPRALLLWWSLWLLASWMMSFGWRWWIAPSPDVYLAAARRLLLSVMLGVAIVWPMFRLMLRPSQTPRLLPLVDWLAMFATLQVLLWPLRLPAQWSAAQLVLLDAMIWSWGLLIGAIVAAGCGAAGRRGRVAAMGACLGLVVVGPLLAVLGATGPGELAEERLYWSPASVVWMMAPGAGPLTVREDWLRVGLVATAAALAWAGVLLWPREGEGLNGR